MNCEPNNERYMPYKIEPPPVKANALVSDNLTVEEIVSEMHRDAIAADAWCETHGEMASAASVLNRHADRIEAAYRREVVELKRKLEAKQAWIDAMTRRSKKDASVRCAVLEHENKWLKSKMEWIVKKCVAVVTSSGERGHSETYGWQLARDILVYTGRKEKGNG